MKTLPFLLIFAFFLTNVAHTQNVPYSIKRNIKHVTKDTSVSDSTKLDSIGELVVTAFGVPRPQIFFYAAGAFKGSGSNPDQETNSTSGEIGFTFVKYQRLFATLGFSLSTVGELDTRISKFGNALLMPGVGKNSFFGDFRKFDIYKNFGVGAEANWTVADWIWTTDSKKQTLAAAPILFKLFATWVPISPTADVSIESGNKFILAFDFGYSMRTLANEAAQNKDFLMDIFKTEKTTYHGIELGISARLNDFKVFSNLSYLFEGNNNIKVAGLTQLQVVFGVALSGNLIRIN